jgi:hypothetical protein
MKLQRKFSVLSNAGMPSFSWLHFFLISLIRKRNCVLGVVELHIMSHSQGHEHGACCNHDQEEEVIKVDLPPESSKYHSQYYAS